MKHDIYAYGMVCPGRLIVLKDGFPSTGGYAEMGSVLDSLGGEAANSSIVLAKLGVRVKLDGNWVEDNDAGRRSLNLLSDYGVDASLIRKKRFGGPEELVVASKNERTIFGNYGALLRGKRHWGNPRIAAIRTAKVLSLDPFFGRASLTAARAAKTYRIPYVTVDGTCSDELVKGAAVTVVSEEFRRRMYRNAPDLSLFDKYIHRCSGLVVFTSGSGLIRYGRKGSQTKTSRPPTIKPIDTSGAGDSFRAGMVYGLLKRWSDDESIRFASALAAMNCLRFPGVLKSPSIKEIYTFMRRHPSARADA